MVGSKRRAISGWNRNYFTTFSPRAKGGGMTKQTPEERRERRPACALAIAAKPSDAHMCEDREALATLAALRLRPS
jgi:hypothetical protein